MTTNDELARNQRLLKLAAIGIAAAIVAYIGRGCLERTYCPGVGELTGVATIAVIAMVWFLLPGADRVVVDDEGLLIHRKRVPWEGIQAIALTNEPAGRAPRPTIEIRLRRTNAYNPPRAGLLRFDPDDLEVTSAEFWSVVRERTPHHVMVLSAAPATGTPTRTPNETSTPGEK